MEEILAALKNKLLRGGNMNNCEACKYYNECSKNLYDATIERWYSIYWGGKDCWKCNNT